MFERVNDSESSNTVSVSDKGMNRRTVVFGGASALAVGALVYAGVKHVGAQEATATPEVGDGDKSVEQTVKQRLEEYGFLWSAASPATHQGDTYTLTATNQGSAAVKLLAVAVLRNPRDQYHDVVINDEVELAAGESRDFSTTNDYGTAASFVTRVITTAADTSALSLAVSIETSAGTESASFNEFAFLIDSRDELEQARKDRRAQRKEARKARSAQVGKRVRGDKGTDDEATPAADVSDVL